MKKLKIILTKLHKIIPQTVGITIDAKVHLTELVSFLIVRQVVPQGKCARQKSIVHIAVLIVQPLSTSKTFRESRPS